MPGDPRSHFDDPERRVVYLKLRKTGGTTLSSSILFPYCVKHGLKYMDPADWWAVHPRLVPGDQFHMMFRHFPDYPQPWAKQWLAATVGRYRLITLLREPVRRVLSDFNDLNRQRTLTFRQYLDSHYERNHQSRWLGFDGRDPDFVEKNFSAVGITERFDESMLLFRQCLGLSLEDMLYVRQRGEGEKELSLSELNPETVEQIRDSEWQDVLLYEQACTALAGFLGDIPALEDELALYRSALDDYRHPLWSKRGSFPIGYSTRYIWSEFDSDAACIRKLRELPA